MTDFQLRNTPLLSRVGADRADVVRTDVDAALAGWPEALVLRVDAPEVDALETGDRLLYIRSAGEGHG